MPTMSPACIVSGTICSRDSSTRMGSPAICGVAAASTNSHRGVITAVPNELSLGLTRCTLNESYLLRASVLASESTFVIGQIDSGDVSPYDLRRRIFPPDISPGQPLLYFTGLLSCRVINSEHFCRLMINL